MYKAFKFRLYPDKDQKELIHKNFGCARFIYNYYLNDIKDNGYKNAFACIKDYTSKVKKEYSFLQEADSILIRKSLFHLEDNLKRFYNSKFGYPRYKSKYDKNSYTTNAVYSSYKGRNYCNIELDLEKREIKLPKLKWVKIRGYRTTKEVNGRIISATISREKNRKYYVSVVCDLPCLTTIVVPTSAVGIDLGIKNLITLSDSRIIENNKYLKKYEKRIKRVQRELSRKEKGSSNYRKCKRRLAILYSKLQNARKYYIHKITKNITDNYDIITCEKLNTKEMLMKKELSKEIIDATFSEIIRQLEYKAKEKGKYFYQVDTYYPSSQICSVCNHQDKKYKNLNERVYECTKCNNKMDRDLNASINIEYEGILQYAKESVII